MSAPTLDYAPRQPRFPGLTWKNLRPVVWLTAALVPLEFAAAQLAYHTIGEIVSGMYYVLILLNVLPLAAALTNRRLAVIGLLLIALLIVPWQAHLAVRWWRIHREADQIVTHVKTIVANTGRPPPDLAAYTFRDPGVTRFIGYRLDSRPYTVDYWIGTPETSHWYDPQRGWMYYPD